MIAAAFSGVSLKFDAATTLRSRKFQTIQKINNTGVTIKKNQPVHFNLTLLLKGQRKYIAIYSEVTDQSILCLMTAFIAARNALKVLY